MYLCTVCTVVQFHFINSSSNTNAVLLSWYHRLQTLGSILAPRPESCIRLDSKSQHQVLTSLLPQSIYVSSQRRNTWSLFLPPGGRIHGLRVPPRAQDSH